MTVRLLQYWPEFEVVPHAIIWRPMRYFTLIIRESEDDLDKFKGASFAIGNDIHFDLRVYQGHIHPKLTVTLYFPANVRDDHVIKEMVSRVVQEMKIPASAVAWQRGQDFQFGKLERSPSDRLQESEARIIVLKIAASQPNQTTTLKTLREELPKYFDLSSVDQSRSLSRTSELIWHIIVRNAASSHKAIFAKGWAEKLGNGLRVTRHGMNYLKSIGFSDSSNCDLAAVE